MTRAVAVALGAGLVVGILSACSMSPRMERAAPGVACPGPAPADARAGAAAAASEAAGSARVRWYRAAEPRDVGLAARWCALVGPPVIRARPDAAFEPWAAGGDLVVASWNMQIDGGDLYGFLATELGLDCSGPRPVLETGRPPFVLLLQEVWRFDPGLPEARPGRIVPWVIDEEVDEEWDPSAPRPTHGGEHDIVETAEACGLSLVYVPSARNGPDTGPRPDEDKGNAILASVPLSDPIALDLPLEGGRKVAVGASVRTPDGVPVRTVTVHLDVASTLVRTLGSGNQTRARQARGLVDGLDRAAKDGPATPLEVVGGDFNTWIAGESTLKLMRRAFPESPPWDGLPTRGGYPTDHVYVRGSTSAVAVASYGRIGERYGSDHHGRRAVLRHDTSGS